QPARAGVELAPLAQLRRHALQHLLVAPERGRAGGLRLDDAELRPRLLLDHHLEEDLEAGGDLLLPGLLGVQQLGEDLLGGGDALVEGGEEALLLAREVLVEGDQGDLRRLRDQLDRGLLVAALGGQLGHRQEDSLALVLRDVVARDQVPSRGELRKPLRQWALARHTGKIPERSPGVYFPFL